MRQITRQTLTTLLLASLASLHAVEPPVGPPERLPTSPAEVTELLALTEAVEGRVKELVAQRGLVRNDFAQAVNGLRNGAFKAGGGFDEAEYRRLTAEVAECDAQMKLNLEAKQAADQAGDKDERAALDLVGQRVRARKDAAQAAQDQFVISRTLATPEGKAAQAKWRAVEQLQRDIERYTDLRTSWSDVAVAYRAQQIPPGLAVRKNRENKNREFTLPPPADAAQRRADFSRRNDAAGIEALAHRLFRSLDERAEGLGKPFALYREQKFAAALEAFRDYFFDKVAHLEKYGVPPDAILTDERPALGTPVTKQEWIDDAMRGVASQPNRSVSADEMLKISVGEPGAVNWGYVPFEPQTPQKLPVWLTVMRQFHMLERMNIDLTDGLRCWLLDAYQVTREAKYLQRWAEYSDDWALNMQRDLNALPVGDIAPAGYDPLAIRRDARQAPYTWNVRWYSTLSANQLPQFVTRLRALALTNPNVAREFPATTLARVLLTGLDEYLSPNLLVARPTRFNWNMMGLSFNVRSGMLLGEFKSAQWAAREAAHTFQNYALFSIMPDGGYVEYSDEGHQAVWYERTSAALALWNQQRPAWVDDVLVDELKESVTRNTVFYLRHLKPDGYGSRDGFRSVRHTYVGKKLWAFGTRSIDRAAPWVTEQAEPQRILGTVFGTGEAGGPTHRSDVMPFLGEFMLRGGWGADDPFFYMHSGRVPNANEDEDCNAFRVHDRGRPLLVGQPVYVDGRTQNQHFHLVDNPGAKTKYLTYTDGQPIKGRWHTSANFDVAEGIYEGAYEDRQGRTYRSAFSIGGLDAISRRQRSLGLPAVTNVQRHTRQVIFVRDPVAWVVVDRVRCDAKHDYEVPFELFTPVDKVDWLRCKTTSIPKADERVVIEGQSIRTDNPGWPQVALHCFSSSPLSVEFDAKSHDLAHKDGAEIRDAENEWKNSKPELREQLAFVRRTLVKWSGEGDQLLVTLITPEPWQVRGEKTAFTATAPGGSKIHFAASTQPTKLRVMDVAVEADTLLLVEPKTGEPRGIRLGVSSAEFTARGVVREIHAPIQPVTFAPNVNVFTDSTAVTMTSATPGVEIRYTLDGSEPGLDSPRYTAPIRLTQGAVVRAIAVRPGAKELRWPLDPGFATVPTRAVFTKQTPAPSAKISATAPGLAWQYAEGQMFALVAGSDILPAQKSGTTAKLLDVSMREGGSAFLVRYDGWLDVPADGVYTFHAPREFIIPNGDPGYDLRVFVDGEEWWPTMRWHALGTWSRALAKGPHRFRVIFVDTRTKPYKHETWQNWPNLDVLWKGEAPLLEVSGPGINQQPIPAAWLRQVK